MEGKRPHGLILDVYKACLHSQGWKRSPTWRHAERCARSKQVQFLAARKGWEKLNSTRLPISIHYGPRAAALCRTDRDRFAGDCRTQLLQRVETALMQQIGKRLLASSAVLEPESTTAVVAWRCWTEYFFTSNSFVLRRYAVSFMFIFFPSLHPFRLLQWETKFHGVSVKMGTESEVFFFFAFSFFLLPAFLFSYLVPVLHSIRWLFVCFVEVFTKISPFFSFVRPRPFSILLSFFFWKRCTFSLQPSTFVHGFETGEERI